MSVTTASELTAARELHSMMQGSVVLRGDDDYARTRQMWNGGAENQAALFAVCETSEDVQAAVRVARRHGLPLSVRGGGHDWAGRALCPDGLVIDLSGMRQVVVDPALTSRYRFRWSKNQGLGRNCRRPRLSRGIGQLWCGGHSWALSGRRLRPSQRSN